MRSKRGDAVCVHLYVPGVFDHVELRRVAGVNRKGEVTHVSAWNETPSRTSSKLSLAANLLAKREGHPEKVWTLSEYGSGMFAELLLSEYRWWPDLLSAQTEIPQICRGVLP